MNQIVKQIKYGYIKAANFTIDQRNHDWKKTLQICIQHIMKENLLMQKNPL